MTQPFGQNEKSRSLPNPRSGIVLVTVLWTIALLAALAMAASMTFRGYAGILAVDRDRARTEALFGAGLEAAASIVAKLGDKGTLTERETLITLQTGSIHIELSDEAGRIDVNKAPVNVLSSLLRSAGAGDDSAEIAKAIDAWRALDQTQKTPAPPTDTSNQDITPAPNNQLPAFTDLRQLLQVPGMTPEILAAISPLTTVFGDDKVHALSAPADVIAALPGVSPAQVTNFLGARSASPGSKDALLSLLGTGKDAVKAEGRPVASVVLKTRLLDGYGAAAKAVLTVLPNDTQPYRVLAWTQMPSRGHRMSLPAARGEEER